MSESCQHETICSDCGAMTTGYAALTARAEAAEQQAARLTSTMSQLIRILGPAPCRCAGQQEEVSQALDVIRAALAASQPAPAAETERGGQAEGEG